MKFLSALQGIYSTNLREHHIITKSMVINDLAFHFSNSFIFLFFDVCNPQRLQYIFKLPLMPDNINSDREAGASIYAAFGGRVVLRLHVYPADVRRQRDLKG